MDNIEQSGSRRVDRVLKIKINSLDRILFPPLRFTLPGLFQIVPRGVPHRGFVIIIVTQRVITRSVTGTAGIVLVRP